MSASPSAAGSGAATSAPSGAGSSAGPAASGSGAATGKLSFATDVYGPVIRARCSSCHTDAPSFGGLTFLPDAAAAYANLVNVPAGAADANLCKASGLARVQPGAPEQSLLYTKLTKPVCGSQMPPAVFPQPTPAQVEIVRKWIADGAAP
jgi:membrane protein involved in colicin uptake